MLPLSATIDMPKRYRSSSRKILSAAIRRPYRLKQKRVSIKKTAAQKEEAKKKREAHKEAYAAAREAASNLLDQEAIKLHEQFGGHSVQWYKEDILQMARLKTETRAISRWNLFLRYEAKRQNQDCAPEGRLRAHELAASAKEKWNAMPEAEKIAITDPLMAELEEERLGQSHGQRNVPLESTSDAYTSLRQMESYMLALHARTGTEMMLIACRSLSDSFLAPFVSWTTARARDFTYNQFKLSLGEFGARFEAYCLAGVEGMLNNHASTTAELKTKLKDVINSSIETLLGKVRMVYAGFEERFTIPYGVVIDKWPIERFCLPSELTRPELDILWSAWSSGTTSFRKMNREEWDKWREDYAKKTVSADSVPVSGASTDAPAADNVSTPADDNSMAMQDQIPSPQDTQQCNTSDPQASGTLPAPLSTSIFINTSGPGTPLTGVRKRKQRSDAGKKRCPRKNKASSSSSLMTSS
ncbi:hypothetical protein C0992_006687 [Termitomyces sp. T32_za158]|nr:hypothetical protein C0992_006687 [Termitomyces sp. T32_za158]